MKDGHPKLIRLDDYESPGFTTDKTELKFDIKDGSTRVTSQLKIRRIRKGESEIFLNGEEIDLVSVSLDGRLLKDNEYALVPGGMTIFGLEETHTLSIVTDIVPEKNMALEGLYRSRKH